MSPQTETKASVGFKTVFRVTPQPGVPLEETGATVVAESSTGTWITVWTDGLTSLDRYKRRCYHIEPVPREEDQYIAYIAYPLDLFEKGSVTNMFTSIVGNVFGFKALRALRLEDLRIPTAYIKTFQGPPHGIQVQLGVPIIMHDYLTGGFTANTSFAHYCRDNGLLLHIHPLRMSGGDHIHSGTIVGKLEGERYITLGFVDLLRDDFFEKDRSRGIYFTQDWVSLPGVLPLALGGIHVWHMPALTEIFGDDSVLQFGGKTLGHPWGNAPGAVANRVALEACASKWSPELAAACEVWNEIRFNFKAVDTLYV
ncbi:hypothetical protein M9H77_36769 [Catharanthus roseus]|uniref:Uncharacterized protein n=1 Tax=Catharanthus roseus TaxID=4058 RepID=A0ACB9ZSR8_CATRO|nr:hypothetical protein M9H77_36769 [Catharanthus roseus]